MENGCEAAGGLPQLLSLLRCIECGAVGQLAYLRSGVSCLQCGHTYEVFEDVLVMRRGYRLGDAVRDLRRGSPRGLAHRRRLVAAVDRWRRRRFEAARGKLDELRRRQFEHLTKSVLVKVLARPVEVALEIGAGSFAQAAELAKVSELVLATEYDVAARSDGRPIAVPQHVMPICADARELPVRDAAADLVFSSNVLEHIPNPQDALREGKRCLAKDGVMVHILPTTACRVRTALTGPLSSLLQMDPRLSGLWQRTFAVHGAVARSYWEELRLFSVRRWRALFRECGFTIVDEGPMIGFWSANYDVDWAATPLFWLGRSEHYFVVA